MAPTNKEIMITPQITIALPKESFPPAPVLFLFIFKCATPAIDRLYSINHRPSTKINQNLGTRRGFHITIL